MDKKKLTQTREAIHKSAKEHFLKHDFQKASLNQIISDTGFRKGLSTDTMIPKRNFSAHWFRIRQMVSKRFLSV